MMTETVEKTIDLQQLLSQDALNDAHSQLTITAENAAYYRSRLFSTDIGLNSLVCAAQPLLSLLPRLLASKNWPDSDSLHDYLEHEMKAFATHARTNNISEEMILLGQYILATTLDEFISYHAAGKDSEWEHRRLQTNYVNEENEQDRFFAIVKRASDYPLAHLELLELTYYCLLSGYKGEYRTQDNGEQDIQAVIDNLYEIIIEHRGEIDTTFFDQTITQYQQDQKKTMPYLRTWCLTVLGVLSLLYATVNYTLDLSAEPILKQLNTVSHYMQTMSEDI